MLLLPFSRGRGAGRNNACLCVLWLHCCQALGKLWWVCIKGASGSPFVCKGLQQNPTRGLWVFFVLFVASSPVLLAAGLLSSSLFACQLHRARLCVRDVCVWWTVVYGFLTCGSFCAPAT